MLRFVTGLTGGGKTKFIVDRCITYLRETDLPIMYWLAFELDPWVNGKGTAYPGLISTLRKEFGDDYDARRRMIPLREDQLLRFYAHRPVARHKVTGEPVPVGSRFADESAPIDVVELPEPKDGKFRLDGSIYGGCVYLFDEAHETFRKKDFNKVSDEALSWASQNRRAGDDAWLLTQQAHLVAKPFRDQSLECYWMINHAYRTFGPFRQWDRISYRVYLNTPPSPSEPHLRKGDLTFRRGYLNGCYDTAKGATVSGGGADIGQKAKGLPWWSVPLGAVGLLVCAVLAFQGCVGLANKAAQAPLKNAAAARSAARGLQTAMPGQKALEGSKMSVTTNHAAKTVAQRIGEMKGAIKIREKAQAEVIGWGGYGDRWIVQMSDGTNKRASSFVRMGRTACLVDGVEYSIK